MIERAAAARLPRRGAVAVLVVHAGDGADRAGAPRAVPARRRHRLRRAHAAARRLSRVARRCASATARSSRTQHDIYGALLETAWLYSEGQHALDRDTGAVLGRIADHVCDIWRRPDSGIWEVRNGPFHFTHSKVMCWVALDRAVRLADRGELPARHVERWRREAAAIRDYVEIRMLVGRSSAATRASPASDDVDASLLMLPLVGYGDPRGARIRRHDRRGEPPAARRRLRLSLSRRRWRRRRRGVLSELFVLAGQRAGAGAAASTRRPR